MESAMGRMGSMGGTEKILNKMLTFPARSAFLSPAMLNGASAGSLIELLECGGFQADCLPSIMQKGPQDEHLRFILKIEIVPK
jgi:hypothetical protein